MTLAMQESVEMIYHERLLQEIMHKLGTLNPSSPYNGDPKIIHKLRRILSSPQQTEWLLGPQTCH
jgi:hypothetical protein